MLAHGLTATRRYVVHGSRLLPQAGYRVIAYDARGHGESSPAPDPGDYAYAELVRDLEGVMDALELDRAVLGGASMGAATTLRSRSSRPQRVEALVQITPAYLRRAADATTQELAAGTSWQTGSSATASRDSCASTGSRRSSRVSGASSRRIRQRLERHEHPQAVADALRVVVRSRRSRPRSARGGPGPTLVVGSRDEADPEHPLEVAQAYAEHIPGAELVVEEPGSSPLAWRGAQLSRRSRPSSSGTTCRVTPPTADRGSELPP